MLNVFSLSVFYYIEIKQLNIYVQLYLFYFSFFFGIIIKKFFCIFFVLGNNSLNILIIYYFELKGKCLNGFIKIMDIYFSFNVQRISGRDILVFLKVLYYK